MLPIEPEYNSVQIKRVLNDARSWNTRSENVLLSRQISRIGDTINIADETEKPKNDRLERRSQCSPKSDLFEVEGILDDTRGGDAHTEDVLLRRQVVGLCYSVYVRQVAEMGKLRG